MTSIAQLGCSETSIIADDGLSGRSLRVAGRGSAGTDLADDADKQFGDEVGPAPLRAMTGGQGEHAGSVLSEGGSDGLVGQAVLRAPDVRGRNVMPGGPGDRLRSGGGI